MTHNTQAWDLLLTHIDQPEDALPPLEDLSEDLVFRGLKVALQKQAFGVARQLWERVSHNHNAHHWLLTRLRDMVGGGDLVKFSQWYGVGPNDPRSACDLAHAAIVMNPPKMCDFLDLLVPRADHLEILIETAVGVDNLVAWKHITSFLATHRPETAPPTLRSLLSYCYLNTDNFDDEFEDEDGYQLISPLCLEHLLASTTVEEVEDFLQAERDKSEEGAERWREQLRPWLEQQKMLRVVDEDAKHKTAPARKM